MSTATAPEARRAALRASQGSGASTFAHGPARLLVPPHGAAAAPSRPVGGSGVRPSPSGPGRFRRSASVLTRQQQAVLEGISLGRSKRQTARGLHVTEDTVRTHALRLFERLGATTGQEAVAAGFRLGLLVARPLHPTAVVPPLPPRLAELMPLLPESLTRAGLAGRLGLSEAGVGDRLKALFRLLGVASREHAVRVAVEAGYLALDPAGGVS